MPRTPHGNIATELAAIRHRQEQIQETLWNVGLDLTEVLLLLERLDKKRDRAPRGSVSEKTALAAQSLFASGMSTSAVASELGIGRTTAHRLKSGTYPLPRQGKAR